MKIRREFKIGVFAIAVILVSWWGIKWLQGQNLLLSSSSYYAYYDNVSGLMVSSRVKLRGVEIGNVQNIELEGNKVRIEMLIEDKYAEMIPSNSVAELGAAGLMGGTEINIIQGDATTYVEPESTLTGSIKPDLMNTMAEKAGTLLDGINTTVGGINDLLSTNSQNITQMITNLESMTSSINSILNAAEHNINGSLNDLRTFTSTLAANSGRIEAMIGNIDKVTTDIAEANFVEQLDSTLTSLDSIITTIENGDGTAGMLINDKALYESLNSAGDNLSQLLEDLKNNPMRYVHFSLFGKTEEQIAEKQAKKEAKAEKKAAKKAAKEAKKEE
jgi:phospholipid/cholesterol/gamma-HCH transport system substrate-binding protein